jgi:hypothetical protein
VHKNTHVERRTSKSREPELETKEKLSRMLADYAMEHHDDFGHNPDEFLLEVDGALLEKIFETIREERASNLMALLVANKLKS